MQAQYLSGETMPAKYTPNSPVAAGDVVVITDQFGIAPLPIAADVLGSLYTEGIYRVVKATGAIDDRALVHWNASGNPLGGDSGSGAASSSDGLVMGIAIGAAADTAHHVDVLLQPGIGYVLD